jgi:hypothetical protein
MGERIAARWHPPPAWRAVLVAEVVAYVAALAAYAWVALPIVGPVGWRHVLFLVAAGAFPIAANLLHGDRPPDSGLRVDNLTRSAAQTAAVTAVMAAGVAVVGLAAGGWHWVSWRRLADKTVVYLVWGPVQQYLLQAFALRRLCQAGLSGWGAGVLAAGLFALLHAPNWVLAGVAFGAGIVWTRLFLRHPNLLTLGLAHGLLGVLLYHAWPRSWLHDLAIGGDLLCRLDIG